MDREKNSRSSVMLEVMYDHVHRRLISKVKKYEGRTDAQAKAEVAKAYDKYHLSNILNKGSGCASGVSIATHIAKGIHPDPPVRKVTNINVALSETEHISEVGSHFLPGITGLADATGNGAFNALAYELYLLLEVEFEERKLWEWLGEQDRDALYAFSKGAGVDDLEDVYSILLHEKIAKPATDTRLKQMYWLVEDDPVNNEGYHLLAPLYATALMHRFHANVSPNTWFFGDQNKAARKARRDRTFFKEGYTSYPNLAVQKLGGTKSHNISHLNSERGGQNYLLASLPPNWESREIYAPMRDAFRAFRRRSTVGKVLDELKSFLEADPVRNMHTRDLRDDLTAMLVDELMLFTFDIHSLPPGWTADEKCRLAPAEQYWLDPGRAALDDDFAAARDQSEWHDDISARAAQWLNRALNRSNALKLGDAEHRHWKQQFEDIVADFRHQLDDLQDVLRDDPDEEGEAA